jgi:hypothetical protein
LIGNVALLQRQEGSDSAAEREALPHYFRSDPSFWRLSPKALGYTNVFAEAVSHRVASFALGAEDDLEAPLALFMNLPPGWVLDRHAHDCHRFEVVIEGSMIVANGDELSPGDVSTSGPGEQYGPHMAGADGVLTLEIFSRQSGLHPVHESPKAADEQMVALIDELRRGVISPAQAAESPVIANWVTEALAEQPRLRELVASHGPSDPTSDQPTGEHS